MPYLLFLKKQQNLKLSSAARKIGGTLRVKSADCFACWVIVYAFMLFADFFQITFFQQQKNREKRQSFKQSGYRSSPKFLCT